MFTITKAQAKWEKYRVLIMAIKDMCSYDAIADEILKVHGDIVETVDIRRWMKLQGINKLPASKSKTKQVLEPVW